MRIAEPESGDLLAQVPAEPHHLDRGRTAGHVGILLVVLAGLTIYLTLFAAHTSSGNSDGATVVLEGSSLRSGHLLLHGWQLSYDSFWTVDAPFYALAVLLVGVRHELLQIIPALLAASTVVLASHCARLGHRGWTAVTAVGVCAAILCFPSRALALFFLQGPLHVGTALFCLGAFVLLRRECLGPAWFGAVLLLTAGLLGDLLTVVLGVLPVLLAGLLAAHRRWDWRTGVGAVGAAVAATLLALVIRLVAHALGAFSILPGKGLTPAQDLGANFSRLARYGVALFGVGHGPFGPTEVPAAFAVLGTLVLGAVLVSAGFYLFRLVAGALSPTTPPDEDGRRHLEDMLVFAFCADLVAFIVFASTGSDAEARYLVPGVIFGAILAGRAIGLVLESTVSVSRRQLATAICLFGALWLAAGAGVELSKPAAAGAATPLGAFLLGHGLRTGIGGYWSASVVTVASNDSVRVRPVIDGPAGTIVRYGRQSDAAWYARQRFQFLVFNRAVEVDGITRAAAIATFGPPRQTYRVGPYTIITWPHPLRVPPTPLAT